MSNIETHVRITATNETAPALNSAVAGVQRAAGQIADAGNGAQRQMADVMQGISEQLDKINNSINAGFDQMGNSVRNGAEQVKKELGNLEKSFATIRTMLIGFLSIETAKNLVQTADAMQTLDNQIRQVTTSEENHLAVKRELLEVANRTTSDLEATGSLYVKTSRALKDYGYSQQEVLTFVEATNNAMAIGGVAAQQQADAILQLSQALGSGVLQGDEFKSISEAAPILLDTIAEYMGKSRAEIKKLGSEGELTADVIFKAISGASQKFAEQAGKLPMTFGSALTVLQNNWKAFVDQMMNGSGIMSVLANAVKLIADNLKTLAQVVMTVAIGFLVQQMATLTLAVGAAGGAFQALWGIILANPIVAVAAALAGVLAATGELENAMDALGAVASDVLDLIATGYQGLADLVSAVYTDMTSAADASAAEQIGIFNGFFDDCGNGFYGLLEMAGKVFDRIAAFIVACCLKGANAFAGMWSSVSNGAVSAANYAIAQVERMINAAINGINQLISLVNSIGGSVSPIGNVALGRVSGSGGGHESKSWGQIRGEVAADQRANGLQNHFAGLRGRGGGGARAGGGLGGGGRRIAPSGGAGGGGGGRKGRGVGAGRAKSERDTRVQDWAAELEAKKIAYQEQEYAQKTYQKWQLSDELAFWQDKLKLVDAGSKAGVEIRKKVFALKNQMHAEYARSEQQQIAAREADANHEVKMQEIHADRLLELGQINQMQRLDMEEEFEQQRYLIAQQAIAERIALASQDPQRDPDKLAQLHEQLLELERQFEQKKMLILGKKDKQEGEDEKKRRQENPTLMEMLEDGGKSVWEDAQEQMSQAFTAMLSRTQSFRDAVTGMFRQIGQTFIQELVTKPLMAEMMKHVKSTALYQMMFGQQVAMQTASSAAVVGAKASETTAVVTSNAVQAASGAAASQAGIPYVGPVLAVAAMGAMMAAVMGLLSGGSKTTTTTTRIPSAAGGWDIPAGINPLTQLHEREMVLPAEHADTIRGLSGGGGGNETIVINATGGDFIHKRDLAKLLKQLNRNFQLS